MAIPQSPKPIYHDPTPNRRRRSSGCRSTASSLSRSTSHFDSPRTACPRDGDAFSFNPSYLKDWEVPQDLWERLPTQLQSSLTDVQHAGAAVLTGYERLEKHKKPFSKSQEESKELPFQFDDLPSPGFSTVSTAESVFQSDTSSPHTNASPVSTSGSTSPVTSSFSVSQIMSPASPISLGLADLSRTRERSFSTPLEPHDAYYATELSHLRTEALPRLRHKSLKVNTDWYEAKRTRAVNADDVTAFENWWKEKQCVIFTEFNKVKRLAADIGLSNTGLGWCAP